MRVVDPYACDLARSIFGLAGFITVVAAAHFLWVRRYSHLLWLIPLGLFLGYIESAFHHDATNPTLSAAARAENRHDYIEISVVMWFAQLAFYSAVAWLARWVRRRNKRQAVGAP